MSIRRSWLLWSVVVGLVGCGSMTALGQTEESTQQNIAETGEAFSQLASFDNMMRDFVRDNKIPGASLAVAKDGRLVYARGFGYADLEAKQPVQPESLFRIASISKPVTAVAVMRLVDLGKVKLDDRVFEILQYEPHLPDGAEMDPRLAQITVRHLLQHTAGWDRGVSIDPMFQPVRITQSLGKQPPAEPDDIIRFMMGWQLDFDPGARYAYSNFGYCLLGRIIEKLTGRGYEEYVRTDILGPLNIHTMRIGKTLAEGRAEGEVRYYMPWKNKGVAVVGEKIGAKVPRPYGAWYLEAMDSHGAWIASAIDLVRFGSIVQNGEQSKVLSQQSMKAMLARPEGAAGYEENGQPKQNTYGCGWMIHGIGPKESRNYSHAGALDGTSTILSLRHDGLCWSVLFNTGHLPDGKRPSGKVEPLIHEAANAVKQWPEHDLFPKE